ncbi:MAG: hypothetical protein K8R69_08310 [Deltaproteobacteria bacterium]|nr:hypothetical protein [Deltaproteobacteria bacterium]
MESQKKSYQIQVHTVDGRKIIWKKQGQPALLPEELVETWVSKFRPDIWEITAEGEMVGTGRGVRDTLKILKVEKVPV